jgi:hypothetical protein
VHDTSDYLTTTQNQLLELTPTVRSLNSLAKAGDPSRLTTLATYSGIDGDTLRRTTDVIGYNVYLGWFGGSPFDFPSYIDGPFPEGRSLSASSEPGQA